MGKRRPRGRRRQPILDERIDNHRAAVVAWIGPGEGDARIPANPGEARWGGCHRYRRHQTRRRRPRPQPVRRDRRHPVGVGRAVDQPGHGEGGRRRHRVGHDRPARTAIEARLDLVIGDRRSPVADRHYPGQIDLGVAAEGDEIQRRRCRSDRRDRPGDRREGRVADGVGGGHLELIGRAVGEPGDLDGRAGDRRKRREGLPGAAADNAVLDDMVDDRRTAVEAVDPGERRKRVADAGGERRGGIGEGHRHHDDRHGAGSTGAILRDPADAEDMADTIGQAGDSDARGRRRRMGEGPPRCSTVGADFDEVVGERSAPGEGRSGPRERGTGVAAVGDQVRRGAGRGERLDRRRRRRPDPVVEARRLVDGVAPLDAEHIDRAVDQAGDGGGRGRGDPIVDQRPVETTVGRNLDVVVEDRRAADRFWRIPQERDQRIAAGADDVLRGGGDVGQGNLEGRRAVGLVGEERVVGPVDEEAGDGRRRRPGGRGDLVGSQREGRDRLEDHLVGILQIAEEIVDAGGERNAVAGDEERRGGHRRLVDPHPLVVDLKNKPGDPHPVGPLEANCVGRAVPIDRGDRFAVDRTDDVQRRLDKVDAVDGTAILEGVAAETGGTGHRGLVATELAVEIAIGGDHWRRRDPQWALHGDILGPILERVDRAVDRLRAGDEVEVAAARIDERIAGEGDRGALARSADSRRHFPVGRGPDDGAAPAGRAVDSHAPREVGEKIIQNRRRGVVADLDPRSVRRPAPDRVVDEPTEGHRPGRRAGSASIAGEQDPHPARIGNHVVDRHGPGNEAGIVEDGEIPHRARVRQAAPRVARPGGDADAVGGCIGDEVVGDDELPLRAGVVGVADRAGVFRQRIDRDPEVVEGDAAGSPQIDTRSEVELRLPCLEEADHGRRGESHTAGGEVEANLAPFPLCVAKSRDRPPGDSVVGTDGHAVAGGEHFPAAHRRRRERRRKGLI